MIQKNHTGPYYRVQASFMYGVQRFLLVKVCAGRADLFELASEVLPKILSTTHSRSELLAKCDV